MHGSSHETGQQPHRTGSYSVQTLLPEQTAQQMGVSFPVADQASCSAFCWPAACRHGGQGSMPPTPVGVHRCASIEGRLQAVDMADASQILDLREISSFGQLSSPPLLIRAASQDLDIGLTRLTT